jgi:hypothetical protein
MVNTLFSPPKNKRIAKIINITSPTSFKESIRKLKKGGITTEEKRALVLAKNRSSAQLKRKNLSSKERKQFKAITKINLPKITK